VSVQRGRLTDEQEELLGVLVESFRSVPRDQRHAAIVVDSFGVGTQLIHNGLAAIGKDGYRFYMGDADELARRGLIRLGRAGGNTRQMDVTNDGFDYYEQSRRAGNRPIERIEVQMKTYLLADAFGRRHPASLAKWKRAEAALWSTDTADQMTTIGHLCREAIQDFATESLATTEPIRADPDIQHTVSRMRSVIGGRVKSESLRDFANALLAYWGSVVDIVNRQEHRAATEREDLTWEDARRAVFQTLIVMHEVDRALSG